MAEAARHSVAPTDSIEEHLCFFIDIFNNLLDSNLSKVSTEAKSNPEFIKPKRRGMPYCKNNHICVHGSDYQFAKSLSCTMRNVEQNARIRLLVGTWLEILNIPHVILCGDDRFIICADDHLSANFACMYAIGQIANQFIFVSITSQESLPVRRNRRSFKHALSPRSATVRYTIDCFRRFVRYLSQTICTLLTVSSWEVVYGIIISWEYSSNVDKLRAWPCAQLQPRPRPCHLSHDEYLLVVRTLLDIN